MDFWKRENLKAAELRKEIDSYRKLWLKIFPEFTQPKSWIWLVRKALGMTSRQLGKRMNMSQAAVIYLEQSERDGVIKLDSLRKAAQAMNCRLVYAFVPEKSLQSTIEGMKMRMAVAAFFLQLGKTKVSKRLTAKFIEIYSGEIKDREAWAEILRDPEGLLALKEIEEQWNQDRKQEDEEYSYDKDYEKYDSYKDYINLNDHEDCKEEDDDENWRIW